MLVLVGMTIPVVMLVLVGMTIPIVIARQRKPRCEGAKQLVIDPFGARPVQDDFQGPTAAFRRSGEGRFSR